MTEFTLKQLKELPERFGNKVLNTSVQAATKKAPRKSAAKKTHKNSRK